jgi:hypothetical protein
MSNIKYLLDENVDPDLRAALKAKWPEMVVWHIGDPSTPPDQTPDPVILVWCEEHGFVLVTNNRRTMPVHLKDHIAAGRRCYGIFILNRKMSLSQTVDALALYWLEEKPEAFLDQIIFLQP